MAAKADLTRGPVLLSLSVGTASFAFATVFVRYCIRKRISQNVGIDDYTIGVATLVAFIGTIFSIVEGVSMTTSARALEFDYLGQPWFLMAATLAKISICLFFIRLVGSVRQWRILLSVLITLLALVNFTFSLTTNLQCRPLAKLWNPSIQGSCWDPNVQLNLGYFQGSFSVFSWLFLSLFPVMIVRDLEMHQAMRWPFYFLSSLSLIAAVFATVRTYETSQAVGGLYTYDTFCATLLAILEQNVGIVAANVLTLGPLFSPRFRQLGRDPGLLSRSSSIARSERTAGANSSLANIKRSTALVIEGPRRSSYENATMFLGSRSASRSSNRSGRSDRSKISKRTNRSSNDWPKGIIKTVSVHVVEEDIADLPRDATSSRSTNRTGDREWETILRGGPPRAS